MSFPLEFYSHPLKSANQLQFYTVEDHIRLLQESNCMLLHKNIQLERELTEAKKWKELAIKGNIEHENYENATKAEVKPPKRKYNRSQTILEQNFSCSHHDCNRKYSSKIALNNHLRKRHSKKNKC